jgi:hypothetical protein
MRKHYIIRIGNGKNLKNTRRFGAFALNSREFTVKKYIELFKPDDVLWFVQSGLKGKLCYAARFKGITNMDLGLDEKWDFKFEYEELINIEIYNLLTGIKGQHTVRPYSDACPIDLESAYNRILGDEKFRKCAPLAMIAYGIRNEKQYKENKIKNETSLRKAKGKGKCIVSYEYLPESPNEEDTEVIRAFCDEYTREELTTFGTLVGIKI